MSVLASSAQGEALVFELKEQLKPAIEAQLKQARLAVPVEPNDALWIRPGPCQVTRKLEPAATTFGLKYGPWPNTTGEVSCRPPSGKKRAPRIAPPPSRPSSQTAR